MKISKVLIIIQLSLMYLSLIFLFIGGLSLNSEEEVTSILFVTGFIMSVVAGFLAFLICVISFFSMLRKSNNDYTKFVMIYKLVAIPWFIGNFIICLMLIAGMLNPFLLIAIPLVIAILVLSTYICMLSSRMINFSYVITAWRNKTIMPTPFIILGAILGFMFCLDVIGAILIFIENKRQLKNKDE